MRRTGAATAIGVKWQPSAAALEPMIGSGASRALAPRRASRAAGRPPRNARQGRLSGPECLPFRGYRPNRDGLEFRAKLVCDPTSPEYPWDKKSRSLPAMVIWWLSNGGR